MNFNEWTRVRKPEGKRGYRHDHVVSIWSMNQKGKKRYNCNISKDMLDALGTTVYSLYEKNGVFAFVPNKHGEYRKHPKASIMTGMGSDMCKDILVACGYAPETNRVKIDAVIIDGAIMFPKDKAEAMALIY